MEKEQLKNIDAENMIRRIYLNVSTWAGNNKKEKIKLECLKHMRGTDLDTLYYREKQKENEKISESENTSLEENTKEEPSQLRLSRSRDSFYHSSNRNKEDDKSISDTKRYRDPETVLDTLSTDIETSNDSGSKSFSSSTSE